MAFTKFIYNLINWKNKSESLTTPLGASNLNKMDSAIKTIGDNLNTVYDELSEGKLDKDTANTMVKDVTYNDNSGIFTITRLNGSSFTIDTKLEKIVTNWNYDKDSQKMILTLGDGTTQEVDLSALITQYEFIDSDTIAFTVGSDGSVTANVKDGSITEAKLQPNYLAEIKTNASNAETSAQNASEYAGNASYDAKLAQSYAVGGSGIRDGESTSNAKYYSEQANKEANNASGFAESASAFAENANRNASYASSYANTASNHASNASASAESASEYAESANQSANEANGHAESASSFAETANRYSNYASGYANTASTHASNASASAQSASESATAAEESAKNAKAEADKIVEIAGGDFVLQSEKGAVNGVAPLDANALIPLEYVPDNPLLKDNASKNLLEVTATTTSTKGVTFTINNDKSVAVNGTATDTVVFILGILSSVDAGDILSGCPSGGSASTYKLSLQVADTGALLDDYGNGRKIENNYSGLTARIVVCSGTTINATFYPMIRRAEIADDTYEPYYASNKELTEIVKEGSVNSAEKLTNPVNIGKASFNGGSDIALSDIMGRGITSSSGTEYVNKWAKFATIDLSTSGGYTNCNGIMHFTDNGISGIEGLIYFYVGIGSNISNHTIRLRWISLSDTNLKESLSAVKVSDGIFELYFKPVTNHFGAYITLLDCNRPNLLVFLQNQSYVDSVEPVATSSLSGYVERALKDANGNVIPDTYMTKKNPTGTGTFSMNRKADADVGDCSSTLGRKNTASGDYSHAEGSFTIASGHASHAEGGSTIASGMYSHAEGVYATASGEYSHAEGFKTIAGGFASHAEGRGAVAGYGWQTAIGSYNDNKEENIFEVGSGSDAESRSNALELTRDGDLKVAGGFKGNADTATKAEQDADGNVITETYATLSNLNSASQNLNNSINRLNLNKASIQTKAITSTGSASFTVKVGSIIFITAGQLSSAGNHLMIAQVRSEGVLSDIYKSSTSAAISLSLSALTLSVGIGSSSGATITVLS